MHPIKHGDLGAWAVKNEVLSWQYWTAWTECFTILSLKKISSSYFAGFTAHTNHSWWTKPWKSIVMVLLMRASMKHSCQRIRWNWKSTWWKPPETSTLIQGSLEDPAADSPESHYCCCRLFISGAGAFVIIGLCLINAFFIMICF